MRIGSIEGTYDSLYRSVAMYGYAALLATSCERKIAGPADPYFDRLQSIYIPLCVSQFIRPTEDKSLSQNNVYLLFCSIFVSFIFFINNFMIFS